MEDISTLSFESALKELEQIVRMLESGEAQLDKSLEMFEKGVVLCNHCNKVLLSAEQKVKMLTKDDEGQIVEKDFSSEE